jgi:hypothetical protein
VQQWFFKNVIGDVNARHLHGLVFKRNSIEVKPSVVSDLVMVFFEIFWRSYHLCFRWSLFPKRHKDGQNWPDPINCTNLYERPIGLIWVGWISIAVDMRWYSLRERLIKLVYIMVATEVFDYLNILNSDESVLSPLWAGVNPYECAPHPSVSINEPCQTTFTTSFAASGKKSPPFSRF